ncbi:hybrid sensor histidine kinase/response regulator [Anaerolineales bacterium HSG24]|nr:hybrid sensor histidine kinase/response regulator [Anaerolineales bacterium HSG24]
MNLEDHLILIVDDNPTNLGVLVDYLEAYDLEIVTAMDGLEALEIVEEEAPDLILLDVMMPKLDGFETCQRLKANPVTQDIPVIFMTALASEDDKVKGFESGAVDYVTKPVQQREVLARVTTHLSIQAQAKQLQAQAEKLQTQADELKAANDSKDKFFSIVAHDLKGPFMPLLGHLEIMHETAETLPPAQIKQISGFSYRVAKRVFDLLEDLLTWARMEMGRIKYDPISLDLVNILNQNVRLFLDNARNKDITLHNLLQAKIWVQADENMLNTIVRNLINNALKFTLQNGRVTVSAHFHEPSVEFVEIWVTDTGVGLNVDNIAKLFRIDQHYTTTGTNKESGTGLGLLLCHEMVTKHGGQIWMESEEGIGSIVKFTMPLAEPAPEGDWLIDISETSVKMVETIEYVVPSSDELAELHILAKRGSMRKVNKWVKRVTEMDEIYRPFCDEVYQLAQEFDSQGVVRLVERFVDSATNDQ